MNYKVTVLGAGLAGCEAALWLAGKGVQVDLYEQKPVHFSPAHKSAGFAELICSNSLKAERLDSASGLLKEEMRRMGSQLLNAAETARVAAGGALAVDRDAFSAEVTRMVESCENITVHREQVEHIDASAPILVATGPLTDGALADEIGALTGDERLHFYDAVAPIVTAESLDYNKVFAASRYDRGEADYLNCPFNKEEYEKFHAALASAERAPLHDFDTGAEQSAQPDPDAHGKKADTVTVYEGCMPIEIMGKTISELEDVAAKGAEAVDAVSGATLVDTAGYLSAIVDAAKNAQTTQAVEFNGSSEDLKLNVVYGAAHGTKCFTSGAVATAGDTIVLSYIDEFQFAGSDAGVVGVPNSDSDFGAGYAEGKVLMSKRVNADYYSKMMAEKAGSTVSLDANYDAIQNHVNGMSIADAEALSKDEKAVDAVSGATLVDTAGYVGVLVDAAK